jgi:hypothetical protein
VLDVTMRKGRVEVLAGLSGQKEFVVKFSACLPPR